MGFAEVPFWIQSTLGIARVDCMGGKGVGWEDGRLGDGQAYAGESSESQRSRCHVRHGWIQRVL